MDHFEGTVDIVVVPVNLDQTGIGLDAIHIVVPGVIGLFHDAVKFFSDNEFAVCVKLIGSLGLQAVGFADEIALVVDHLEGTVDIVVVPVDLDQAGIGLDVVDIVVPDIIGFLHDAVLHFLRSLNDHLSICIKGIFSGSHESVCLGNIVFLILYHGVGAFEIVVISISLNQSRIGNTDAMIHQIGVALIIVESREVLQPHTGFIKDINFLTGAFMIQCLCNSCRNSASICICEILLSVHSEPLVLHLFSCPEVMDADFVSFPSALHQNVVLKDIGMPANAARSVDRRLGRMVKVIIFICSVSARDESPSCYKLSVYGVVDIVLQLKQPGQLSGINAVIT